MRDLLCPVTYPDEKADWLPAALKQITARSGALSLEFLATWPVEEAFAWLVKLSGVGPKAAAAVLNFLPPEDADQWWWTPMCCASPGATASCPSGATRRRPAAFSWTWRRDAWTAGDFYELHWLMKRLGQMRCTHGWARCGACPVAASCARRDVPERSNVARLHVRPR